MADTVAEPTLDQQLEEIFKPAAPAAASAEGAKPTADTKQPAAASPPAAETPAADETPDPLLAALDAIEEPKAEEAKGPELSAEQSQILAAVPNVQIATQLREVAQNYANFTDAFAGGRFDDVQNMFESWNPRAWEGFMEHVYETKVANGEWVDRFIAEQEGGGKTHKEVASLKRELAQFKSEVQRRNTPDPAIAQQQRDQQAFSAYSTHITGLLEKINFNAGDRRWVVDSLNTRVAGDPKLVAAIKSGNLNAVNSTFKAVVKEYVNRDKTVTEQKETKIAEQNKHKPPIGAGGAQMENALPDDIKEVPKGKEDNWLDQQLGKLFKKK